MTTDQPRADAIAERIAAAMDTMGLEGNRPNIVHAREIVALAALAPADPTGDCGYECPYTKEAHEHGIADHVWVARALEEA